MDESKAWAELKVDFEEAQKISNDQIAAAILVFSKQIKELNEQRAVYTHEAMAMMRGPKGTN